MSELHYCRACWHRRMRPEGTPFSPAELEVPEVLKAFTEWQQQRRQQELQERQQLAAGDPFMYEPHTLDWCARYTKLELVDRANHGEGGALEELMDKGGAVMSSVTGEVTPIYAMCQNMNPDGKCEGYEPGRIGERADGKREDQGNGENRAGGAPESGSAPG